MYLFPLLCILLHFVDEMGITLKNGVDEMGIKTVDEMGITLRNGVDEIGIKTVHEMGSYPVLDIAITSWIQICF